MAIVGGRVSVRTHALDGVSSGRRRREVLFITASSFAVQVLELRVKVLHAHQEARAAPSPRVGSDAASILPIYDALVDKEAVASRPVGGRVAAGFRLLHVLIGRLRSCDYSA